MFGSNVGFWESADLMVQLSMTFSDHISQVPQFQGHSLVQRRISRKMYMLQPNISSALCIYDGYTVSTDNIPTYSNDTNVVQSLSNSWASYFNSSRGSKCRPATLPYRHCCMSLISKQFMHLIIYKKMNAVFPTDVIHHVMYELRQKLLHECPGHWRHSRD